MLNPLLVQLFGRDVVDRLENSGLTTDDAIARLEPEELSARACIPADLARRIVALAAESLPGRRPPGARRSGAAKPRATRSGARRKKTPGAGPAASDPAVPSERAAAPSAPADPMAEEEEPEIPALQQSAGEIDAFVDEAGLIAWMGFAARSGPEGSLVSSVADGILEPAPPREEVREQAPGERSGAVTIEGSFWGFGNRPHGGATISPDVSDRPGPEDVADEPRASDSTPARPVPFHRRRSHDGH